MRQAGVSLEHDDRASVEAEHLTLDSGQFATATTTLAPRPGRRSGLSPQPEPNPIAVEVAERYARELSLSATLPAPPEPRTPRRSRAAMRDRALDPAGRRSGGAKSRTTTRAVTAEAMAPSRPTEWDAEALEPRMPSRPTSRDATARDATVRGARTQAPGVAAREQPDPVLASAPAELPGRATGIQGRRTVTIRGRGAERNLEWPAYDSRRRPARPVHERPGFRPDRAALWAFVLGLLLVLVAATSAHGAMLAHAIR